ncbi:MAG: glutathione binding-like protein [Hydrotalea sp.]|nr:glutathione binding-like protein [Hydrotalea sp.]
MPDKIQLYSLATPNGVKVAIALEEMAIPYDAHLINISKGDQFTAEFIAINPNSKIPAIVDPDGPGGKPFPVIESGAILLYLAEKTGKFLPKDAAKRSQTIQWLFWQMAGLGPMFGQFGHFTVYAPEKVPYAIDRYTKEVKRLLAVLDKQLTGKKYVIGDELTIADFAIVPWVRGLETGYKAGEVLELNKYTNVTRWRDDLLARPAVERALTVCKL